MILSALTPIFAIVLLGFVLSRTPLSSPEIWEQLERFTYYLFFSSLLVLRLSSSRYDLLELGEIGLVLGLALAVITLLIVGLREFISKEQAALSSVYQGSIRFNTYIGLACIDVLYGNSGLTLAALVLAVYIPLVNLLCVISLTSGGQDSGKRLMVVAGSLVTNPLVLACLIGIAISSSGYRLPELLESTLEILSQPTLPLGLLAVGAGIRFIAFGEQSWQLLVAVFNKLLAFPALILLACLLFETDPSMAAVILLLTCLPAPPSAYIMARQLGGNASLMANIITLQTLAAFFLIPLWIELGNRFL
jgi:malonate transporter and related proteins